MSTLTAANSSLSISISDLYSSAQSIQGYAVDDAVISEAVEQAEVRMGVDGKLSAGKVFNPYKMTIHLMATSSSVAIFETWRQQQNSDADVYAASGTLILSSTGYTYTLNNGYLTSATPFPAVKKVLDYLVYEITWESITSAQLAS